MVNVAERLDLGAVKTATRFFQDLQDDGIENPVNQVDPVCLNEIAQALHRWTKRSCSENKYLCAAIQRLCTKEKK